MVELVGHKRKAIDDTFRRMFDYDWGTQFDIDEDHATMKHKTLLQMFGRARASRILGAPAKFTSVKKRKLDRASDLQWGGGDGAISSSINQLPLSHSQVPIIEPILNNNTVSEPSPLTTQPTTSSKIDDVLKRLAGPSKTSTVQKTNDDWESFKETDKHLQEELEKQAQGKDAFLVKQDFLLRVDNRKFEIEKEARDKERAKRMTQG